MNKRLINPGFEAPTPPVPTSFNTITWDGESGNGSRDFSGVGFQPDLVWVKRSSSGDDHHIYDSVRGAGVTKVLASNKTAGEPANASSIYGYLDGFLPDGFSTVSGSANNAFFNENGQSMVAWCWKAGGSAVTNTDGTITSQVSANTEAGFSIVNWQGNGGVSTHGHGLDVAPNVVIVKARNGDTEWFVYHSDIGATKTLRLYATDAAQTLSVIWNNTEPTSSVFTTGSYTNVASSSYNFIAYCFAEVAGFSKFGSYSGGSTGSGAEISVGFEPAFVLVKKTDVVSGAANWWLWDNKRNPASPRGLQPNLNNADNTIDAIRFTSTGFYFVSTNGEFNNSGSNFIYMAFANQF